MNKLNIWTRLIFGILPFLIINMFPMAETVAVTTATSTAAATGAETITIASVKAAAAKAAVAYPINRAISHPSDNRATRYMKGYAVGTRLDKASDKLQTSQAASSSESVATTRVETRSTHMTQKYFREYQPASVLRTSDQIDTRRTTSDTSWLQKSKEARTRDQWHESRASSSTDPQSLFENSTDAYAANRFGGGTASRSQTTTRSGPITRAQLVYNALEPFPELQRQIPKAHKDFLDKATEALSSEVTKEQLEECIFTTYEIENIEQLVQELTTESLRRIDYIACDTIARCGSEHRYQLARQMFFDRGVIFIGIPRAVQAELFNAITELQNELAQIIYSPDGSFRGLVNNADRAKWESLITEFAKRHVYKDRRSFNRFLAQCRKANHNGSGGFLEQTYAKGRHWLSQKWHGRVTKEKIIDYQNAYNFNEDYAACELAMEQGDLAFIQKITDAYIARAPDSLEAQEHAQMLSELLEEAKEILQENSTSLNSSEPNILGSEQTEKPQEDAADLRFQVNGKELYSIAEYIKETDAILAKMEKGPAQIAAKSIRNYMATQWEDLGAEGQQLVEQLKHFGSALKDQHALMTADALCNMFDRAISDMTTGTNPIDEWKKGIADIGWRIQKAGELTQGLMNALVKLQDGIFTPMDTERFITLVREGNTQEAARMIAEANPMFGAIQEKVQYNLQHPVSFLGRTARGIIDIGMTSEQLFVETVLSPLQTEAEQAAISEQRVNTFENFVKRLNSATPEQINDVTSSIIADGLTFKVLHNAKLTIRSGTTAAGGGASSSTIHPELVEGSSSGTGIVPRKEQLPATQSPTFDLSKGKGKAVAPKLISAQQASEQAAAPCQVNMSPIAILKDGYYEVNGFRFTDYYYNRLWTRGRKAPSLIAQSILDNATNVLPDPKGYDGFYKYMDDKWYMIYNPITKIVSHLEPLR